MANHKRRVINWDKTPEKKIADRLAALYLMLDCYSSSLPEFIRDEIRLILESDNPKAEKYYWANQIEHRGEKPEEIDLPF